MNDIPAVLCTYSEGLKARDVERIAGTVADDLAGECLPRTLGKEQFLAMLRAVYAAFPDWHYEQHAPERHGEVFAIKWRQGGTHSGTFALAGLAPVPATGKTVQIPWHYFYYRVRGDRIVEIRPEPVPGGAPRGILEQIGVAAPPLREAGVLLRGGSRNWGPGNRRETKVGSAGYEPAEPTALPTVVKVLLAFLPSVVMAVMHTTMISASMTAYSTAVGPSSRRTNSPTHCVNFLHRSFPFGGLAIRRCIPRFGGPMALRPRRRRVCRFEDFGRPPPLRTARWLLKQTWDATGP